MSNYAKLTDFAAKDNLTTGNPAKVVKGTEIDNELLAIAGAIASKADTDSPTFTGTPTVPTPDSSDNSTKIATTAFARTVATAAVPVGEIKMWPTATAPTGFLKCDGTAVSRTIYSSLFALIGVTFGVGDGTTTFNLPNFNNRMAIGAGDLYAVAATGGSKDAVVVSHTHTATVTDPGHTHTVKQGYNTGNYNGDRFISAAIDNGASGPSQTAVTGISVSNSTAGESGTNKNLPPYLGIYFIIKT